MKKLILLITILTNLMMIGQERLITSQISVSGEGIVKVIPDEATISIAVETKGDESAKVMQQNNKSIDKVIKYLKSTTIDQKDIKTERVNLYPQYDYDKKKNYQFASQTIEIVLRDLSFYDILMEELLKAGVTRINSVSFQSSKIEEYKSEARKLAVLNAKKKAEDFATPLNQKVGKAILVTDNSAQIYNTPVYRNVSMMMKSADVSVESSKETIAIGEIEINTVINITFTLD